MKLKFDKTANSTTSRYLLLAGLLGMSLLAAVPGTTLAHEGAKGAVKQRMVLMESIGKAMKSLTRIFKGEVDYDAEAVKTAAVQIQGHGGEQLAKLFPEGSLDGPTEASPKIWQDWSTFSALWEQLGAYSSALEKAADNAQGPGAGTSPGMMSGAMGQGGSSMIGQGQGMTMKRGAMMGGGGMTGRGGPTPEMLAQMPPQAAFGHLARTCNACHSKFRIEK